MGKSSVAVDDDGARPVVYLKGEFDLANRSALTRRLESFETLHQPCVVIDLSAATFLDSTIIGALITAHARGLNLTIRGASGRIQRNLEVLGIPDIFPFED